MTYRVFGGQTYTLQSAISSTQTTINLSSFTVPVSGDPVTMALLGTDIVYATIDPKTSSSEFISLQELHKTWMAPHNLRELQED